MSCRGVSVCRVRAKTAISDSLNAGVGSDNRPSHLELARNARHRALGDTYRVRIFLAGASGVIGQQLIPLLVAEHHEVLGMTRSPGKQATLQALGATSLVCDALDLAALTAAVQAFQPDVVIDELTDLPDDPSRIAEFTERNSALRREGTKNLLAAAHSAGVTRFLVQSVAWELPGDGGAAVVDMERSVLQANGVVLRYGSFYGPGTYYEERIPDHPRIHVQAAASQTLAAIEAPSGVLFIVEHDESDHNVQ